MENNIVSPVSGTTDTSVIERYESKKIQAKYLQEYSLDVTRFLVRKELLLVRCNKTGFRFFYPKEVEGDGTFYAQLEATKKSYYHERWEHGYAYTKVDSHSKWLEVGAGDGFFLKKIQKKTRRVSGLELNATQVDRLRAQGLNVYNQVIEEHLPQENSVYDGIALFQVLEHVYNVSSFFENARRLLKKDGRLIISVPNNNPYLYKFDKWHTLNLPPHHVGYWNKESLRKAGGLFGFRLIDYRYDKLSVGETEYALQLRPTKRMSQFVYNTANEVLGALPKKYRRWLLGVLSRYVMSGRNICVEFKRE